jgi:hypothetical protein
MASGYSMQKPFGAAGETRSRFEVRKSFPHDHEKPHDFGGFASQRNNPSRGLATAG